VTKNNLIVNLLFYQNKKYSQFECVEEGIQGEMMERKNLFFSFSSSLLN